MYMDSLNTSENQKGQYVRQFQLSAHKSNYRFTANPYVPKTAPMVCFSLTGGANYITTHGHYTIGGDLVVKNHKNKKRHVQQ
jgi:hypothetical protein